MLNDEQVGFWFLTQRVKLFLYAGGVGGSKGKATTTCGTFKTMQVGARHDTARHVGSFTFAFFSFFSRVFFVCVFVVLGARRCGLVSRDCVPAVDLLVLIALFGSPIA